MNVRVDGARGLWVCVGGQHCRARLVMLRRAARECARGPKLGSPQRLAGPGLAEQEFGRLSVRSALHDVAERGFAVPHESAPRAQLVGRNPTPSPDSRPSPTSAAGFRRAAPLRWTLGPFLGSPWSNLCRDSGPELAPHAHPRRAIRTRPPQPRRRQADDAVDDAGAEERGAELLGQPAVRGPSLVLWDRLEFEVVDGLQAEGVLAEVPPSGPRHCGHPTGCDHPVHCGRRPPPRELWPHKGLGPPPGAMRSATACASATPWDVATALAAATLFAVSPTLCVERLPVCILFAWVGRAQSRRVPQQEAHAPSTACATPPRWLLNEHPDFLRCCEERTLRNDVRQMRPTGKIQPKCWRSATNVCKRAPRCSRGLACSSELSFSRLR